MPENLERKNTYSCSLFSVWLSSWFCVCIYIKDKSLSLCMWCARLFFAWGVRTQWVLHCNPIWSLQIWDCRTVNSVILCVFCCCWIAPLCHLAEEKGRSLNCYQGGGRAATQRVLGQCFLAWLNVSAHSWWASPGSAGEVVSLTVAKQPAKTNWCISLKVLAPTCQ